MCQYKKLFSKNKPENISIKPLHTYIYLYHITDQGVLKYLKKLTIWFFLEDVLYFTVDETKSLQICANFTALTKRNTVAIITKNAGSFNT